MNFWSLETTLRTPRLELRPQTRNDVRAILEGFASDPRVTKYMDWRPLEWLDLPRAYERQAELEREMASGKRIAWVIRKLDESGICGKIGLSINDGEGEVGYILAASYWGQGIMPEALAAVLEFARQLPLRQIVGACDPENRASIRVFEKCGFRYAGRRAAAMIRPALSDEPRDSDCYELTL